VQDVYELNYYIIRCFWKYEGKVTSLYIRG